MTQNAPRDERTLQRRLADMERRLRALETAPRAAKTSFGNGQLTVGDPASDDRIEISAAEHKIRINTTSGPTDLLGLGSGGAMLRSEADIGEPGNSFSDFGVVGFLSASPGGGAMQISRIDGSGFQTIQANIGMSIVEPTPGSGNAAGAISIRAVGSGAPNSATVEIDADGGTILYSGNRTTDPPTPPAGCITLYVKGTPSRLYYRDPGGTVHGPL